MPITTLCLLAKVIVSYDKVNFPNSQWLKTEVISLNSGSQVWRSLE
jgi:hypothetical protein